MKYYPINEELAQRVDPMYLVSAKSACLRFPLRGKLRPLPCTSSPHRNRFAGFRWGPPQSRPSGFVGIGAAHLLEKRLFHDIVLRYIEFPCNSITFGCLQIVRER